MNVLLFGVSNVGKTTTAKCAAEKMGWDFYDLDEEVKKHYHCTLEQFVKTGTLKHRDQKRLKVLRKILSYEGDKFVAVTPLSRQDYIYMLNDMEDVLNIELVDSAENIFDRLVFSDENDVIYKDDEYKNKHRAHYIKDIEDDQQFYGTVYLPILCQVGVAGRPADEVADDVIDVYKDEMKRLGK